jgi:hypothetical protein
VSSFPESDWKNLREIRERALSRFCTRALDGVRTKIQRSDLQNDAHNSFLAVYRYIDSRDKELGRLFNDWRRSTALRTLMGWVQSGIVTEKEFESFSESTKRLVRELAEVRFFT